ncbi:MAG: glycosyltransferase family 2 protein [Prolixibacteraceae bacterium]|nr:glycosyltransferase family 2 protein [Prolixibacteraceae bacterium]
MGLIIVFWILFFILFYTFIGYAIILRLLVGVKRIVFPSSKLNPEFGYEPNVCLFVTAFNEKDFVEKKVQNSFSLNYPKEKIQYLWMTDGSDDGTPEILRKYENLEVHHQPERRGKIHAMNRGIFYVKAPIIIFSDANTTLGPDSIREIVNCFADPKVGCVAGEKRILEKEKDDAAGAGEGLYWKFESWVKKLDGELNSAVGGVGELFAIRRELYEVVENDTILDDFIISLRIAKRGFRIAYAPRAYAEETASVNVNEELKRKIRIAAGGVQTIFRLKELLNPFRFGLLSWQYISHKVLRWTIAPLSLFLFLIINLLIVVYSGNWNPGNFYTLLFYIQIICYVFAVAGWYFENKQVRQKIFFVPYYFVSINYASIRGIIRYFKGKQSVNWERSKRA